MRSLTAPLLSLLAGNALAHPGDHHQSLLSSLGHLLTEPDHLAMILIALVVGITFLRSRANSGRGRKQP